MQCLEGLGTAAGISKGRGRAGAARKLIGMQRTQEGKGELQKLKAEGPPCSGPCPDLGRLPLHQKRRQRVGQEAGSTNGKVPVGAKLPQGPRLTRTRVEVINILGALLLCRASC